MRCIKILRPSTTKDGVLEAITDLSLVISSTLVAPRITITSDSGFSWVHGAFLPRDLLSAAWRLFKCLLSLASAIILALFPVVEVNVFISVKINPLLLLVPKGLTRIIHRCRHAMHPQAHRNFAIRGRVAAIKTKREKPKFERRTQAKRGRLHLALQRQPA